MKASGSHLDALIVLNTADLYYLSGTVQTAHLLVTPGEEPRLLVRKVLERARGDSPLELIEPLASMKDLPERIAELCGPPPWRIGMELDVLPATSLACYEKLLGSASFTDASPAIMDLRSVKSDWELDQIRNAAVLSDAVYKELPQILIGCHSVVEVFHVLEDAYLNPKP